MKRADLEAADLWRCALIAFPIPVLLALYAFCLWLTGCTSSAAATAPSGPETALVGTWAAPWPDSVSAAGLVTLSLAAGGTYQATIDAKGVPVSREAGKWLIRASRVVFTPATCEAAAAASAGLVLVTCTGPDSVTAAAAGNRWTVDYTSGDQLMTLTFRRL